MQEIPSTNANMGSFGRRKPRGRARTTLGVVAAFFVSGGLFAIAALQLDVQMVIARVQEMNVGWLMSAFFVAGLLLLVRSVRLLLLAPGLPFMEVVAAISLQTFLVRVTPMRLGELALPYSLERRANYPMASTIVALLFMRLLDLWMLLSIAAIAAISWAGLEKGNGYVLIAVTAGMTALALAYRVWLSFGLRIVGLVVERTPARRLGGLVRFLDNATNAARAGFRLSTFRAFFVVLSSASIAMLLIVMFWFLLLAFDQELSLSQVLVGVTSAQIAGIVPIATVGSVGAHEVAWTAGFVWVGVSLSDAAFTGVATQLITVVQAGILAAMTSIYTWRVPAPISSARSLDEALTHPPS